MFCWTRSPEPYIIPIRKKLVQVNTNNAICSTVQPRGPPIQASRELDKKPAQQALNTARYKKIIHPAPSKSKGSLFLLSPLLSRLNRDDTTRDVTELARDRLRDAASDGRARKFGRIEGGRDVARFCDGW